MMIDSDSMANSREKWTKEKEGRLAKVNKNWTIANIVKQLFIIIVWIVATVCAGCVKKPLITYSLDTPPAVIAAAGTANFTDGRGRFREIYCAIRESHGKSLPDDRPCDQAVLRLNNEPAATGSPVYVGNARSNVRIVVIPGIFSECIASKVSTFLMLFPISKHRVIQQPSFR